MAEGPLKWLKPVYILKQPTEVTIRPVTALLCQQGIPLKAVRCCHVYVLYFPCVLLTIPLPSEIQTNFQTRVREPAVDMGIQGLLQFLKDASEPVHVKKYRGQTVAVDTYCWLHKGAFSCAEKLAKGEPTDQYVYLFFIS